MPLSRQRGLVSLLSGLIPTVTDFTRSETDTRQHESAFDLLWLVIGASGGAGIDKPRHWPAARLLICLVGLVTILSGLATNAEGAGPLTLAQKIALPNVQGRIDHFAFDEPGKRLFVCALGNNTLEVIDLRKGERTHSIPDLANPQGVAYIPELGRLVVTNDKNGDCNIYDGKSFSLLSRVILGDDADNVRYSDSDKKVYIGYGNGGLSVISPATGKKLGSVDLAGHPEAFILEKHGPRIFVNIPSARRVAVVDRAFAKVVAQWKVPGASENFPMAFDEAKHRLFIGCRSPAELMVLNSDSGAVAATLPIPGDVDDLFYDESQHRLLAVCGAGSIAVIDQANRDTYKVTTIVSTASGARTGLFVPVMRSLFVAVPRRGEAEAEIWRYSVE
jgi:DNA-binding beta-propeller fold protein YncE